MVVGYGVNDRKGSNNLDKEIKDKRKYKRYN